MTLSISIPLWGDEEAADHTNRVVTDGTDRVAWHRARSRGITATDAARLATSASVAAAARAKFAGGGFGNAYTEHGKAREPEIAAWVRSEFGIQPNRALFHAEHFRIHLATPDGIGTRTDGVLELCEIKTTNRSWRSIPRHYLRQVWWQQHVLGAQRTLVVWEQHREFVPERVQHRWVDRDDAEIGRLLGLAELMRLALARRAS